MKPAYSLYTTGLANLGMVIPDKNPAYEFAIGKPFGTYPAIKRYIFS